MTPIGKYSEGSRKKKIFDCFTTQGPEAAWTLGLHKLKLKENTLRSWFSTWKSVSPVKAKAEPKAKPKVEAKPKAAKPKAKTKTKKGDASPVEAVA